MKASRTQFWPVALLLTALLAGCGPKRPPVVATSGGAPPATTPPRPDSRSPQLLDPGPDLQPVGGEGLGEDFLDTGLGEGGPLADIYFGFDSSNLTEEARATLEKHGLWLQNRRELRVLIEGHCDERGAVEYNLALGTQRAQTARDYLLSLGVAPERLTTVSYGKERPVDPGHDEAAWAKNRRVHFNVRR